MSLAKNVKDVLVDRLDQAKKLSELMKNLNEAVIEDIKGIQSTSEKTAEEQSSSLANLREKQMKLGLVNQTVIGITPRLIELYTLLKISDIEPELEEKDVKFLEKMMKEAPLDLFRVEKGELKIMNEEYHNMVMSEIKKLPQEQLEGFYAQIKAVKV